MIHNDYYGIHSIQRPLFWLSFLIFSVFHLCGSCRVDEFSKSGFNDHTVMICDQVLAFALIY